MKILSDLGTIETAARHAGGRNRGRRRQEAYHFDRSGLVPRGIYKRRGADARVPVFVVTRQPRYRAIFDFRGVAERVLRSEFARNFRRELAIAVAESRARRKRQR